MIGAGSTAEEPAGIPQSQPTPGPSGVRNNFRGEVSRPQQEDGLEEVVILQEDIRFPWKMRIRKRSRRREEVLL